LLARTHMRDRIDAGIGDASGENRDNRRCCRMERVDDGADLIEREDRGDVERHAFGRERADELAGGLPLGVGDWNLNVDVWPPGRDRARLLGHAREVVGKDFERDRPVRDRGQNLARERLVIADPSLSHQRRIGGEALDHGVFRHLDDALIVGTIGKNLDLEIGDPAHAPSCAVRTVSMMTLAASAIERTTGWGAWGGGREWPRSMNAVAHRAARPASTSLLRSPTMKLFLRLMPSSTAASRIMPGLGLRQSQCSPWPWKQALTASRGN